MARDMARPRYLALIAVAVFALAAAFFTRAAWIRGKIEPLSAPPSLVHAPSNTALPKKSARPRLVLIGDSRIARWPADTFDGGFGNTWEIINRGIGGETVAQLAGRFEADALALDPDVIVIAAGINDLVAASYMDEAAAKAVVSKTADTLRDLAARAAAAGHRVLVATIVPPARPDFLRGLVWKDVVRGHVVAVNAALRAAPLPAQASVIDLAAALGDDRTLSDAYRLDTLHFNAEAYARLTAALRRALADKR
jgi:lysophospholipase L1-like esterase